MTAVFAIKASISQETIVAIGIVIIVIGCISRIVDLLYVAVIFLLIGTMARMIGLIVDGRRRQQNLEYTQGSSIHANSCGYSDAHTKRLLTNASPFVSFFGQPTEVNTQTLPTHSCGVLGASKCRLSPKVSYPSPRLDFSQQMSSPLLKRLSHLSDSLLAV